MKGGKPERPGHFELVLILAGMSILAPLSTNMYLPVLTEVSSSLSTSLAAIQQTIASFMLGMAGGQLLWGALADRFGRRNPLLAALAVFCFATYLCATARSADLLIAARLVQGGGASAGVVIARAIISDNFEGARAATVISWQQLIQGLAPILSPLVGGMLLVALDWRAIFWVLLGLGVLVLIALVARLPETRFDAGTSASKETWFGRYCAVIRNVELSTQILAGAMAASPVIIWYAGAAPLFRATFGWSLGVTSALLAVLGVLVVTATQANRRLLRHATPRRILEKTIVYSILLLAIALAAPIIGTPGANEIVTALLMIVTAGYGFIAANSMANILTLDRARAGSIAALFGLATYSVGALITLMLSYLPPYRGISMLALTMAMMVLAWWFLRMSKDGRRAASPAKRNET
ncbi:Bcr/CflA family efflux MFS transporter [Sphingomonas bisphenolicum]